MQNLKVGFRDVGGDFWWSADFGGNAGVNIRIFDPRKNEAPSIWEHFMLDVVNDGPLQHGCYFYLRCYGGQYVVAKNGGGDYLYASSVAISPATTFLMRKVANGSSPGLGIVHDDIVTIATGDNKYGITAGRVGILAVNLPEVKAYAFHIAFI